MPERWFMAKCRDCTPPLAMPFSVEAERLVRVTDVLHAIDEHYKELHNDE